MASRNTGYFMSSFSLRLSEDPADIQSLVIKKYLMQIPPRQRSETIRDMLYHFLINRYGTPAARRGDRRAIEAINFNKTADELAAEEAKVLLDSQKTILELQSAIESMRKEFSEVLSSLKAAPKVKNNSGQTKNIEYPKVEEDEVAGDEDLTAEVLSSTKMENW